MTLARTNICTFAPRSHSWENAVATETRVLWVFSDGLSF